MIGDKWRTAFSHISGANVNLCHTDGFQDCWKYWYPQIIQERPSWETSREKIWSYNRYVTRYYLSMQVLNITILDNYVHSGSVRKGVDHDGVECIVSRCKRIETIDGVHWIELGWKVLLFEYATIIYRYSPDSESQLKVLKCLINVEFVQGFRAVKPMTLRRYRHWGDEPDSEPFPIENEGSVEYLWPLKIFIRKTMIITWVWNAQRIEEVNEGIPEVACLSAMYCHSLYWLELWDSWMLS